MYKLLLILAVVLVGCSQEQMYENAEVKYNYENGFNSEGIGQKGYYYSFEYKNEKIERKYYEYCGNMGLIKNVNSGDKIYLKFENNHNFNRTLEISINNEPFKYIEQNSNIEYIIDIP